MASIAAKHLLTKLRFIEWLSSMSELSRADLAVAIRIVSAYNAKKGYAYPSLDRIANDVGITRRQVIRSIATLESMPIFTVWHSTGRGHANEYSPRFDLMPTGDIYASRKGDTAVTISRGQGESERVTSTTERVTGLSRNSDTQVTPTELLTDISFNRSSAEASPGGDACSFESEDERDGKVCAIAERALRNHTLTRQQAMELIERLDQIAESRASHDDDIGQWANRLLENGDWPQ